MSTMYICFVFFFFNAEDGIRDESVTGVQTCALPINDTATTEIYTLSLRLSDLGGRRIIRSEERRVGKEGRSWWSPYALKKKEIENRSLTERPACAVACQSDIPLHAHS